MQTPFAADGSYSGNNDEVQAPVNTDERIGATLSGERVFLDGGDMFALLDDLVLAMRENRTEDIGNMIPSVGGVIDHLGTVQAEIGTRMQRIDSILESHGDESIDLVRRLGAIEDVDLAEVIVDLQQSETASTALSQAAVRVLGRSLFDYLG
jgi:flagellar hook-associated protein 3 FlgL